MEAPKVQHHDGTKMPKIGLGTYLMKGDECTNAVEMAIDIGFRHIDTAFFYENERDVGKAIRSKIEDGTVKRQDLFVVTKLWCHFHEPERVEHACRLSLSNLGLEYIDLYLMHWPYSYVYQGADVLMPKDESGAVQLSDVDYLDTWRAMESLVNKGLTRSIGVSNFNSEQLKRLVENCKIKPIHNQIEVHPFLNQSRLLEICKGYGIVVTAYCPLGRPNSEEGAAHFLNDARVLEIAQRHGKTVPQVILRFLIQLNCVPIPKSRSRDHLMENINIFDFELEPKEMEVLNSFDKGERVIPMVHAKASKYYPFNIPF